MYKQGSGKLSSMLIRTVLRMNLLAEASAARMFHAFAIQWLFWYVRVYLRLLPLTYCLVKLCVLAW